MSAISVVASWFLFVRFFVTSVRLLILLGSPLILRVEREWRFLREIAFSFVTEKLKGKLITVIIVIRSK